MPFPNPDTQFKPGVAPNPRGYSKGRRVSDALARLMEDKGLAETVAVLVFAAATDDQKILRGRKPNAQFMAMLLERYEGKLPTPILVNEGLGDDAPPPEVEDAAAKIYGPEP